MTFIQLRYFTAIVDAGFNITLAATRVYATQSTLSKQLKLMEDELGFLLFSRRGRTLAGLTPGGEQVLEQARGVLAGMGNIGALAANLRADHDGELRIATTHTQARYVLPPALGRLASRYPRVSFHLAAGGDRESLQRLDKGEAELAIVSTGGDAPDADIALPLYRWQRVVLVPADHPLAAAGDGLRLEDLVGPRLISYESSREPASSLRRAFAGAGLDPQFALTARDGDLIKTYVRAGMGVGILAEMALPEREPGLVTLPAEAILPGCTAWLLLKRDQVLRDFGIDFVLRLLPGWSRAELRRVLADETPVPASADAPHWRDWRRAWDGG
ncbi:LysR family transcriptional regulator [Luteimonas sp. Y-2-2-4F]|nr:LysR substrate-binding domain-containing protein [Luteimonas sp. Y-2-2-4F]MCD9032665.1 LysR family transcriptional regulator [Luteimonas sp. Y-2-2-4F]